jgi:hypothetical protein
MRAGTSASTYPLAQCPSVLGVLGRSCVGVRPRRKAYPPKVCGGACAGGARLQPGRHHPWFPASGRDVGNGGPAGRPPVPVDFSWHGTPAFPWEPPLLHAQATGASTGARGRFSGTGAAHRHSGLPSRLPRPRGRPVEPETGSRNGPLRRRSGAPGGGFDIRDPLGLSRTPGAGRNMKQGRAKKIGGLAARKTVIGRRIRISPARCACYRFSLCSRALIRRSCSAFAASITAATSLSTSAS